MPVNENLLKHSMLCYLLLQYDSSLVAGDITYGVLITSCCLSMHCKLHQHYNNSVVFTVPWHCTYFLLPVHIHHVRTRREEECELLMLWF